MEHLNRVCKECVRCLAANKTEQVIVRYSKCIGPLEHILAYYDSQHRCGFTSNAHTIASSTKDQELIMQELVKADIVSGRMYTPKYFQC